MPAKRAPVKAKKSGTVTEDFVTVVDGTEIRLPSLTYLKPGLLRRIRNLGETDAAFTLLELVLDDEALAVTDEMSPEAYDELFASWREHSGVSLGES